MRHKKNVVIFLPWADPKLWRDFVESYDRAKLFMALNMYRLPFDFHLTEYTAHTFPIDSNRNECATRAVEGIPLDNGAIFIPDITIWLDSDHILPDDALFKLLNHDLPIVMGVYYVKSPKKEYPFYPVLFRRRKDNPDLYKAVMEFPPTELFEIDFGGMGCVAIQREVFMKLDRPYFKYILHPKGGIAPDSDWKNGAGIEDVSEDRWFWEQIKAKTDYPILVDPTIQLGHIGYMVFDEFMYSAWLRAYKEQLEKTHGKEKYEQVWSEMAVAEPWKKNV